PLVPLHKLVIFPYMNAAFEVNDTSNVSAFEGAMNEGREVFLVTHQVDAVGVPEFDAFNKVGTVTRIKSILRTPTGPVRITVEGLRRAKFLSIQNLPTGQHAEVQDFPREETAALLMNASRGVLLDFFHKFAEVSPRVPDEAVEYLDKVEDCDKLCDLIAAHALDTLAEQLEVLNLVSVPARIEKLCIYLAQKTEQVGLQMQLEAKVKQLMEKNQREYFLREQMKVIRKELGDTDLTDVTDLAERLDKIDFEPAIRDKLNKELSRLSTMTPGSPDINVARTYLETIADLPWGVYTEDDYDLDHARKILARDHFGLEKVKERILEYLAVHALTRSLKGTILCLVGPPGVGKTSIARSIASALNRSFVRMSLGGVRDEAEIRGHRRTYIGAIPGRIITSVKQAGTMNPVMLLDEIDKMASDLRGDPAAALLEVLDSEQNNTFRDHYLDIPFDLSQVMFVITANSLDTVSRPLLDRMEVIELGSYTPEEKLEIAKRHLLPKQLKENGLNRSFLRIDDSALRLIISDYTAESGVRTLERTLGTVCRKAAIAKMDGRKSFRVNDKRVHELLGPAHALHDKVDDKRIVGCVTGLAWTSVGGEILTIEATAMQGSGQLQLTGKLGDVMQESAKAAVSYIRAHAQELAIDPDFHKTCDLHIHVPMGATPKDGPSAGVTMVTAIYSALSGKPVDQRIAMTGEISLRGRVLPIGGLKEKSIAAHRAGATRVLFPADNRQDLEEVPQSVREALTFTPVSTLEQVLRIVFEENTAD
ncbi:MAG: endopeptidase La, partial [Candidatus Spyradocola sp.]